ncbi:hypothetical protein, partial [Aureimonas sp. AU40]|uniref:hypothetical protein n=1 Tax=Aureimonas sp. AU40 TaxID=1637747 RepID=UPI000A99422C
ARDRQSAADWSVIAPTVTTHERIEAVYTYPAARPLTERTEAKAAPQPVAAPSSTLTGTLVPGSDSF